MLQNAARCLEVTLALDCESNRLANCLRMRAKGVREKMLAVVSRRSSAIACDCNPMFVCFGASNQNTMGRGTFERNEAATWGSLFGGFSLPQMAHGKNIPADRTFLGPDSQAFH